MWTHRIAGGLSFNTFGKWVKPDMWEFIHGLNTAYKIPERHRVATELFSLYDHHISTQVKELLADVQFLNFVCDESDDQACRRITTLSVDTPQQGAFFLQNFLQTMR